MKVAINQPYFLPYIGLMEKAKFADLLIINDYAPISSAKKVHRRVKILGSSKAQLSRYLTELVYHKDDGKPFNHIFLNNSFYSRIKKLINAIQHTYARTSFFSYLSGDLYEQINRRDFKTLGEFNFNLIKLLLDKLNIKTEAVLASESGFFNEDELKETPGKFINHATYAAFRMCQLAGATTYISGQSGPQYLGEQPFSEANIEILYQQIDFQPYPQFTYGGGEFMPGLSVIDLIFNCGPEAEKYIGLNSRFLTKI